uniref:Uncharacterized protein n=1 Tax=Meloidogyne enterolobii TaxID=390850 RepID=A0A6V7XU78_MELEN|nr:unnamed protein product [Meloidogyne enterolobii]
MAFGVLDKMMFTEADLNVVNKYNNKIKLFFEYRERINEISDNTQIQFLIGQPGQIFKKVGKDIATIINLFNTMQKDCKTLFERSEIWKIMNDDKQEFIDQETTNIKKYNRAFYKLTGLTHDQNLAHPHSVKLMQVDLEKTTETIKALKDVLAANRKKIEANEKGKKWSFSGTKKNTVTEELVELNKIKKNADDDLKILELYVGICKRMNVTVENILNNIKKIVPKDFYKKLVVLYTKIDLYKGVNEKIKELHEIVNEIKNQKEPNPAALFKEEANLKKFKRMIVLRKVIISQYLKSLGINENELKANIIKENMEEGSSSTWSTTTFITSTDAQSSNSGSSSAFGESSLAWIQSPSQRNKTSSSDPNEVSL